MLTRLKARFIRKSVKPKLTKGEKILNYGIFTGICLCGVYILVALILDNPTGDIIAVAVIGLFLIICYLCVRLSAFEREVRELRKER